MSSSPHLSPAGCRNQYIQTRGACHICKVPPFNVMMWVNVLKWRDAEGVSLFVFRMEDFWLTTPRRWPSTSASVCGQTRLCSACCLWAPDATRRRARTTRPTRAWRPSCPTSSAAPQIQRVRPYKMSKVNYTHVIYYCALTLSKIFPTMFNLRNRRFYSR